MKRTFLVGVVSSVLLSSLAQAETKFTSRYIDTADDCSCVEKDLEEGQDCTQFKCKEINGYQIQTLFDGSACDIGKLVISKDSKKLLTLNEVPKKLEWRFANDEPFAIIYRIKGPNKVCADQLALSVKKETLIVSGLGKFSAINGQIEAKTANANVKIREIADQGFSQRAK